MFPPHRIAHGVVEPAEHVAANRHGKTYIRELETDLAPVLRPFVLGRQKSASIAVTPSLAAFERAAGRLVCQPVDALALWQL